MLAKIDAILAPFVRWTIIILGGGIAILLLFFVPAVRNPGGSAGAEETFRKVQAELDRDRGLPVQSPEDSTVSEPLMGADER